MATADVTGAGTDSDVQARLTDQSGRTSPWTVLDIQGHNDFEADSHDTYPLPVPPGFDRPASLQLWKSGTDAWAVKPDVYVTGPAGYTATWNLPGRPPHLWITGPGSPAPSDSAPAYAAYSPDGPLAQQQPGTTRP
ncbi:hypothetical protein ACFWJT_32080 [Streptomyces sp. NPDC127069]|uniref:hypothetical protein n=1 Tax=Streptomyces sp. NPDC127069 TaxID=3347128 RepID=UPI00365803AD